jgi:hypothetical protein
MKDNDNLALFKRDQFVKLGTAFTTGFEREPVMGDFSDYL